jgi:hypothetical protein
MVVEEVKNFTAGFTKKTSLTQKAGTFKGPNLVDFLNYWLNLFASSA